MERKFAFLYSNVVKAGGWWNSGNVPHYPITQIIDNSQTEETHKNMTVPKIPATPLKSEMIISHFMIQIRDKRQEKIAKNALTQDRPSIPEVARFLGISRMGVQKAVIRGREFGRYEVSLER